MACSTGNNSISSSSFTTHRTKMFKIKKYVKMQNKNSLFAGQAIVFYFLFVVVMFSVLKYVLANYSLNGKYNSVSAAVCERCKPSRCLC